MGRTRPSGVLDASAQQATEALLPHTFTKRVGCKMVSTCTSFSHVCSTHFTIFLFLNHLARHSRSNQAVNAPIAVDTPQIYRPIALPTRIWWAVQAH